jgi:hypothetical protein
LIKIIQAADKSVRPTSTFLYKAFTSIKIAGTV